MSQLGGVGGPRLPTTAGGETVFGQLAQFLRFRPGGGATSGQPLDPTRPVATTPQELVQAAIAHHIELPAPGTARLSESYICVFSDPRDNRVLARIRTEVEYSPGTARSTRYSRARRLANRIYRSEEHVTDRWIDPDQIALEPPPLVTCRRLPGTLKSVPTR